MKMKWIVELDYDICGFEPNAIYFRRVYSNEIEYSSAYDTKREALEAFCQGERFINQLRKEREAEQKCGEICGDNRFEIIEKAKKHLIEATNIETSKDEMACLDSFLFRCWQMGWLKQYDPKKEGGWDKAIKEAKEKYGYGKPEERIDVVRDFSPKGEAEQKKEEEMIKEAKEVAKAYECFPRLKICGEQKKEEKKRRPCENCEYLERYTHGCYCRSCGQPIKMDRETCIVDEREEERRNFVDLSRYLKTAIFDPSKPTIEERLEALEKKAKEEIKPYELSDTDDIIEASKKIAKEPSFARYVYSVEIMKADHGHRLDTIEAHIAKIEERLTEVEGVLSSIGSPDYDLRKKVEEIEKDLYIVSHLLGEDDSTGELKISKLDVASQKIDLLLTFLEAVCRNLGNDIKKINNEAQTDKKDIEEINEVLEMVDKGKADTFYEQANDISKNDYKECKANPFRCEKCGIEFKIVSQERALVEHCPSCGNKPKRIED